MKFRIEEAMQEKGFNNVKLAEKLGVSRSTITNNLKKPTLETLEKIANVLDIHVVDLFETNETDNKNPLYIKDDDGNEKIVGWLKK